MNCNSGRLKQDKSMLPLLLRRYGVLRVTLASTILTILVSVAVTVVTLYFVAGEIPISGIAIAVFVPLVIAPIFTYNSNKLVHLLDMAEEDLRLLSNTDELTQTFNRRYFFEQAHLEFERSKRYGHHFSIAILDFDNFKDINDGYSHLAGDAALKYVAQLCFTSLRQTDVFARYGGDEFVFLFPDTDVHQARESLDRILIRIGSTNFEYAGFSIPIRVSIGVSSFHASITDLSEIMREADFALYAAKHQSGMQVIAHPT
jgi:diguanylate cyclase (GGDEF)-like protein